MDGEWGTYYIVYEMYMKWDHISIIQGKIYVYNLLRSIYHTYMMYHESEYVKTVYNKMKCSQNKYSIDLNNALKINIRDLIGSSDIHPIVTCKFQCIPNIYFHNILVIITGNNLAVWLGYCDSEYILLYAQLRNGWGGIYVYMWYRAPMPLYSSDICDCDMCDH